MKKVRNFYLYTVTEDNIVPVFNIKVTFDWSSVNSLFLIILFDSNKKIFKTLLMCKQNFEFVSYEETLHKMSIIGVGAKTFVFSKC